MGSTSISKHIVLHGIPGGWGHNKPLCALAIRILENRPEVVVTYLTGAPAYSKIIGELKHYSSAKHEAIQSRLNIIDIAGPLEGPLVNLELDSFAPAFAALYSSGSLTCLTSGKTIHGYPAPTLAIIDPFSAYAFEAIREIAGKNVSILAWFTSNAGSSLRLCGPAYLGGVADPALETPEGRAAMKRKIIAGEPIKSMYPVLPPSYDYEWFPSSDCRMAYVDKKNLAATLETICQIYIREADGLVCVSANVFEPEAVAAAKEWFSSMKKPWYNVGPLSIDGPKANAAGAELQGETFVVSFLNRIQSEFGPNSLLYMSFGTVFWPEAQDRLWAVLDGLIVKRQPFLFSHPSPFQKFPDEMKKKIADSGIAMEVDWAPQELILAHPVTGWFLTHGGWNSIQEAFMSRVPLIFWPFQADQPYNAMRMSYLKAGFALMEVRAGKDGTRKPYNCEELPAFTPASAQAEIEELVDRLRGNEGSMVRTNFEALADAMNKTWEFDGESRKDLSLMLENFLQ
ncbi:UDP-Glycosyltransferase/glycogen phosphorylase [Gymnopus androsaceus JB14]|uniref:UDP-Glycosyltransferase/glycogen phosphorylase n=1 Tax=Gymnopus androsaceus JB14 TaxID=1447944 RepID=A0A6A4I0B3_9AGAR|nr:UDP-Glycosyltransferase/glycogen phosphorylase [Gymnopus androsaceus JB14]